MRKFSWKDAPPTPTGFMKHAPQIEGISKVVIGISFLLYAVGLTISAAYEQRFGILSAGLLRARYVLVGLTWALMVASLGACWIAAGASVDRRLPFFNRALRTSIAILVRLGMLEIWPSFKAWLAYDPLDKDAALNAEHAFLYCNIAVLFLALTAWVTFSLAKKIPDLLPTRIAHISPASLFRILGQITFLMSLLPEYSYSVYSNLPYSYGGSAPPSAYFMIKPDRIDAVRELGIEITDSNDPKSFGPFPPLVYGRTGLYDLISDSGESYVISRQSEDTLDNFDPKSHIDVWRIAKDDVIGSRVNGY